jgi:hypothetical protein
MHESECKWGKFGNGRRCLEIHEEHIFGFVIHVLQDGLSCLNPGSFGTHAIMQTCEKLVICSEGL